MGQSSLLFKPGAGLTRAAQNILEAAGGLFSHGGYEGVSISEIANQAGVSKANIFHHFKSKEELYLAVLKGACSQSIQILDSEDVAPRNDPADRIGDFLSGHLKAILERPLSTRLIQRGLLEDAEYKGKKLAEEVFAETFSKITGLVEDVQEQGAIKRNIDASLLAFLLVGANIFYFETRSIVEHLPDIDFPQTPELFNEAVFELLAHGFVQEN